MGQWLYPLAEVTLINYYITAAYASVLTGIVVLGLPNICPNFVAAWSIYGKAASHLHSPKIFYLPKSWFVHFYLLAVSLTCWATWNACNVYFGESSPPPRLKWLISKISSNANHSNVQSSSVVIALFLMLGHVVRRLCECLFVNVFSNAKMSLLHYVLGISFYAGMPFAILTDAPLFGSFDDRRDGLCASESWLTPNHLCGILMFAFGFFVEFQSHWKLANLRKDEKGHVTNFKHSIPRGGLFELVSCPNYFGEILVYLGVYLVLGGQSSTWAAVLLFVVLNQVVLACMNHEWYKNTFPDYPKNRRIIIPYLF